MGDLRYAFRQLAKSPGFTTVVALTLGLGIGATTAIYTLVDAVLLRPLEYPNPERIATVWSSDRRGGPPFKLSGPDARDVAEQTRSFSQIATYRFGGSEGVVIGDAAENIQAAQVSESFFDVLGVHPAQGRPFSAQELDSGGVAVVGDAIVQRSFNGDATRALDGRLKVLGQNLQIVGVMPAGFSFPDRTEIWLPGNPRTPSAKVRSAHNYYVLARLAPGVPVSAAQAELNTLAGHLARQHDDTNRNKDLLVIPLQDVLTSDYQAALWLLLGAVGLVLLIACANVSNLLLARGARRAHEIAIRAALGAGRRRIARQLLTESLVLAILGGLCGVLVAYLGLDALKALAPAKIPRLDQATLNGTALVFASGISILVCILIGFFPATKALRFDLDAVLRIGSYRLSAPGGRLRSALVVAQLATSLVLSVAAGLLIKSLHQLTRVDPGYRVEKLLVVQTNFPGGTTDGPRALAFIEEVSRRVSRLPGVTATSFVDSLPLGWVNSNGAYWIEGRHRPGEGNTGTNALFRAVGPKYFSALGISLRRGREIDRRDTIWAPRTVVINQAMARVSWPNANPLGRRIRIGWTDSTMAAWMTIVGVVEDTRQVSLDRPIGPELFIAAAQHRGAALSASLVIRTSLDPRITSCGTS